MIASAAGLASTGTTLDPAGTHSTLVTRSGGTLLEANEITRLYRWRYVGDAQIVERLAVADDDADPVLIHGASMAARRGQPLPLARPVPRPKLLHEYVCAGLQWMLPWANIRLPLLQ